MKKKLILVLAGMFLAMVSPLFLFAADVAEEDTTPRSKKIYLEPNRSLLERGKFKFILALTEGYDNNTQLDSRRDGDAYTQLFFKGMFSSSLNDKTNAVLDFQVMDLTYASESKLNLVVPGFRVGLDHALNKYLSFSTGYSFNAIEYISTGGDDFVENMLDAKLTHKLPYKMYHSLGYEFFYRNYSERKTRNSDAVTTDKERADFRNTLNYEIGKYFKKDLFKINFQYYKNDSNDPYLNYYDYQSFKIGGSLTHIFTDKIFGYGSFSRQFRPYRSRTLINDTASKEWEKTYLMTTALYYNMNKSLSFGLSYTYRQNWSNESLDRYSGSLISLSSYYRF